MNYDIIVIGGGIIGFSTAYQLIQKYRHLKIAVLEKEGLPAMHQTGHNSGVIHAGVYYQPGSLKAKFCVEGNRATQLFCCEHNIPFRVPGKLIVAINELELQRLQDLAERCKKNGLDFLMLDQREVQNLQPGITAVGAIHALNTGIVDWKQVTQKYVECFKALGGKVFFNKEVQNINEKNSSVSIEVTDGTKYECAHLISCAGLYADRIIKLSKLKPEFKIVPFRGEYYKLSEKYSDFFKYLIYPVPDPNLPFLGVHFTPQIAGYTTVGPNAVLALAREGYSWSKINTKDIIDALYGIAVYKSIFKNFKATLQELHSSVSKSYYLKRVQKYFPFIQKSDLFLHPAGVRAQAIDLNGNLIDDFLFVDTPRMMHTCNAPSPAATSSLPIGNYIVQKFEEKLNGG